ncbi:hypothetical protein SteCoe_24988 [Stentor coeruleus]|uniref:GTP-binding protein n=1 Tax=Stentor coeruleus TaxID=5963 RepID=A0A1R2BG98_9CILI|nr:hypothetical protein SteCoe_24988 [Stentor coeruleus]
MSKILLIGDSSVGKTSLLLKYADNEFIEGMPLSSGLAQKNKSLIINNSIINLSIWDIAGTEQYKSMTQLFFKNGQGALLVYDKTNSETFNCLSFWLNELYLHIGSDKPVVIIANKIDKTEDFQVTTEQGQDFANSNNCKFFEVSAKTGDGINEAFYSLASQLNKNIRFSIILDPDIVRSKKKYSC